MIRIPTRLSSELSSLDDVVYEAIEDSSERKQALLFFKKILETIQKRERNWRWAVNTIFEITKLKKMMTMLDKSQYLYQQTAYN